MENAMTVGPGVQAEGRSLVRIALALAGVALAIAALLALAHPAGAQTAFTGIICGIFNSLAAAIPFLRAILSAIAAAFGCVISG